MTRLIFRLIYLRYISGLKMRLNSLTFKQALLFLLMHERRRHLKDIKDIEGYIRSLHSQGVQLDGFAPEELDIWVDA